MLYEIDSDLRWRER